MYLNSSYAFQFIHMHAHAHTHTHTNTHTPHASMICWHLAVLLLHETGLQQKTIQNGSANPCDSLICWLLALFCCIVKLVSLYTDVHSDTDFQHQRHRHTNPAPTIYTYHATFSVSLVSSTKTFSLAQQSIYTAKQPTMRSPEASTGAGTMETDDRQVMSFHRPTPTVNPPSALDKPSTLWLSWSGTIVGERAVTPHLVVRRQW